METYANVLLIALPSFMVLILIEILYGYRKKNLNYNLMDTISSLSAGATNIIKSLLGIGFAIISYPYIVAAIALVQLEESMGLYLIAFVCIDLASYWNHRLNHSINIFWNRHVVHHSSEEFNLACALRQSISNNIIGFGALFLIPAALFGVPSKIIILLAPLHLFAQFWYHTQHIGKLGWLEYVFVTPSQHRVHHAINEEYVDKNLSAIFCVWDRIFGTFQEELDAVPCIYGSLKPVQTWNPIVINFQHNWGLAKDAWHAKNWVDKFKLWFMPTGWRPEDVSNRFPRPIANSVYAQEKYAPKYTTVHKIFAVFQFVSLNVFIYILLVSFGEFSFGTQLSFGILIFTTIFGFTSIMDGYKWAFFFEISRNFLGGVCVFYLMQLPLLEINFSLYVFLISYFIGSLLITFCMYNSLPERALNT
jgi:alkylglycerol monooxygenase|tara:strand:- start:15902 stop:17161 length:1260 start_codon:yes stop_codon:yes gene_type:complete